MVTDNKRLGINQLICDTQKLIPGIRTRDQVDYLPSTGGELYGDFINWGLIPYNQAHGAIQEFSK